MACAPLLPRRTHPAIVAAMHMAGPTVYVLVGCSPSPPWRSERTCSVDMLVGRRANAFVPRRAVSCTVASAIDLFAGPTDTLISRDTVDGGDLPPRFSSAARMHGPTSHAISLTNSESSRVTRWRSETAARAPCPRRDRRPGVESYGYVIVLMTRRDESAS